MSRDPIFVQLVRLVLRDADPADGAAAQAVRAVTDAALSLDSAAGFAETLELLVASPTALTVVAESLTVGLLAKVSGFSTIEEPNLADVSKAADALEAVTRLKVGGYGTPYALHAALERFRAPVPPRLAVAVIRSVGTSIDQWPEAAALADVVKAQAGMTPADGTGSLAADPDVVASDASWVLANIELLGALRAARPADMVAGLQRCCEYLNIGADTYEREDAQVLARVVEVVGSLAGAEPTVDSLDAAMLAPAQVAALVEQTMRFNMTSSGLTHWYNAAKRQSITSWVALVEDLREVQERFAEDSFYRPEAIINRLLQIYLASRSTLVVRRDEDLDGVLDVIQPVIESGFASKAGFIANLDQYTRELKTKAETVEAGDERTELLATLDTATHVLDVARTVAQRGDPPGKGGGGAAPGPLPPQLEKVFAGTPEAAQIAAHAPEVLAKLAAVADAKKVARNVTLTEGQVLDALAPALVDCPDYNDETVEAVDEILLLIVRFVDDRLNVQSDSKAYLFDAAANESHLHDDLYGYLKGSHLGSIVEMEVQHIGAGRVDIRIKYPTFAIHLELKHDDTKKAMADKAAYLKQVVAYQASDIRLGFLVALRTKAFPPANPPPHLTSLFGHTTFDVPGDTVPRHVVLVQVPGNRTKPSAMKAKQ